jgi:anti-sigma-K factor RskA
MALSSSSEHLQLLIAGYVLGDLTSEEAAEFEQLLQEDAAIAQEVEKMQQVLELSYAPPAVAPPDHLRTQILNAATQQSTSQASTPSPQPRSNVIPWGKVAGVIAAGTIVALGLNNYRLWQNLQTTQAELRQSKTLVYSLQPTNTAVPASATVVVNSGSLEAVLDAENLPPLPPGKVYALWAVLEQGSPFPTDPKGAILTGVFEVNDEGRALEKIQIPEVYRNSDVIAKVAVTLEDADAPEKHIGDPIMITQAL